MIAALYVETGGAYFGLDDVEPWDEQRDARNYEGPWAVVAHPPCNRWSVPLAYINQTRYGHKVGDDGGCFASALEAVQRFGGVLEHPRESVAFKWFGLPRPRRNCWVPSLLTQGYSTVIDQWAYGHPCKKETWLYCCGIDPPDMDWRIAPAGLPVISWLRGSSWYKETGRSAVTRAEASRTPERFRDALCEMARSAQPSLDVLTRFS